MKIERLVRKGEEKSTHHCHAYRDYGHLPKFRTFPSFRPLPYALSAVPLLFHHLQQAALRLAIFLFLSFTFLPSFRPPVVRHATIRSLRVPVDVPSWVMSTVCMSHGHGLSRKPEDKSIYIYIYSLIYTYFQDYITHLTISLVSKLSIFKEIKKKKNNTKFQKHYTR